MTSTLEGGPQKADESNKISWFLYVTSWGRGSKIRKFCGRHIWKPPCNNHPPTQSHVKEMLSVHNSSFAPAFFGRNVVDTSSAAIAATLQHRWTNRIEPVWNLFSWNFDDYHRSQNGWLETYFPDMFFHIGYKLFFPICTSTTNTAWSARRRRGITAQHAPCSQAT